jgi:hypothetical protein
MTKKKGRESKGLSEDYQFLNTSTTQQRKQEDVRK